MLTKPAVENSTAQLETMSSNGGQLLIELRGIQKSYKTRWVITLP